MSAQFRLSGAFAVLCGILCPAALGGSLRYAVAEFAANCVEPAPMAELTGDLGLESVVGPVCESDDHAPGSDTLLAPKYTAVQAEIAGVPAIGYSPLIDIVAGTVQPLATHAIRDSQEGKVILPEGALPRSASPPPTSPEVQDIGRIVAAWTRAWSDRDPDAYLRHYSAEFTNGERGFSLTQWRQQRRERLLKQNWIKVKAQDLRIEVTHSGRARVRFLQDYRSPTVAESSHKTLVLRREKDAWRIVAERSE